jgi:hypothetical protein
MKETEGCGREEADNHTTEFLVADDFRELSLIKVLIEGDGKGDVTF